MNIMPILALRVPTGIRHNIAQSCQAASAAKARQGILAYRRRADKRVETPATVCRPVAMPAKCCHVSKRHRPGGQESVRLVAGDGAAVAAARVRPVIPHGAVLDPAIVPERDPVLSPAEAALAQRVLHVLVEGGQDA